MLGKRLREFLRDEQGSYTLWSLTWFILFVMLGGLAVDVTDAYRNQTLLQATADAAALAGAMSLPDEAEAVDHALAYAAANMAPRINGTVLTEEDVHIGTWDFASRTFTLGGSEPNAVHVITRRAARNANPVQMNFLRILSLFGLDPQWDVNTAAIAVRYQPECLRDGLVARLRVDLQSNNSFYNGLCAHGQENGVAVRQNNYFEPGVQLSMADLGNLFAPNPEGNVGLLEALVEGDLWPLDVSQLDELIAGLQTLDPDHLPAYMHDLAPLAGPTMVTVDETYAGPYLPYHVYDVNCTSPGRQLSLPGNTLLEKVVIVADCRIHAPANSTIVDGVLASSAMGNGANPYDQHVINLAGNPNLGLPDDCEEGGGVEIYAAASVHIAAGGDVNGLRVVAGGDVELTANAGAVNGISVQAGQEIHATANNAFGRCTGGVPGRFAWTYRLVW